MVKSRLFKLLDDSKVRYLLVGGSSAALEWGSFWLLFAIGLGAIASNMFSFLFGFIYTFVLHRLWSFAGRHNISTKKQFLSYGLLAAVNIITTSLIVGVMVDSIKLNPLFAKTISMTMVVVWNYLILNKLIFKRN